MHGVQNLLKKLRKTSSRSSYPRGFFSKMWNALTASDSCDDYDNNYEKGLKSHLNCKLWRSHKESYQVIFWLALIVIVLVGFTINRWIGSVKSFLQMLSHNSRSEATVQNNINTVGSFGSGHSKLSFGGYRPRMIENSMNADFVLASELRHQSETKRENRTDHEVVEMENISSQWVRSSTRAKQPRTIFT